MKAGSAQFALFQVDGFDLIPAKLQTAAYKIGALQEPTHGLGDRWEETTPTGVRRVTVTQTGAYFDTSAMGIHDAFKDAPMTERTLILAPTNLQGGPLITATGLLSVSYEVLAKNGKLTRANVTYVVSGAVTEATFVQTEGATHAADWTSATVDNGQATAKGGTAVQDVTATTAGKLAGVLRHSPDNVTFTDLVTFPDAIAPARVTVPVSGTIERYVQYRGTLSGKPGSVTVVASLARKV